MELDTKEKPTPSNVEVVKQEATSSASSTPSEHADRVAVSQEPILKLKPLRELAVPAGIFASALIITIVLWIIKYPKVSTAFDVQCRAVRLQLASDWTHEVGFANSINSPNQRIRIKNVNTIAIPSGKGIEINSHERKAELEILGTNVQLTNLSLKRDSTISLGVGEKSYEIAVEQGAISGMLKYHGPITVSLRDGSNPIQVHSLKSGEAPGRIGFKADVEGAIPSIFLMDGEFTWLIHDLEIRSLGLSQEVVSSPGSKSSRSSIINGNVSAFDEQKSRTLYDGDWLKVEGLKQQRRLIISGEKGLRVQFEGTSKNVIIGPKATQSLAISLLEYLGKNQPLVLIAGGVAFLAPLLLSITKLLFHGESDK